MDSEAIKTTAILEWRQSLTGYLVWFGIITAIFVGISVAILATGTLRDVTDNWSRYRCNPAVMPFAELFGYDSSENLKYCVRAMMQSQSGEFFKPIYGVLGEYSTSLGLIVNTMQGFRQMLGNFKLSTDSFIGGVMAKIQALMFQLRITFMRMQTLMGRVYGTMYSMVWLGTSSITAGLNLADNDLVNFMFEFCFAPDTPIRMVDGTVKPIREIQMGDMLEGGVRVTSTLVFKGDRTPMVRIGDEVMSAAHRVFCENAWIPASQHPSALPTPSIPLLYCLNVEGHAFRTGGGLLVADYDESEDPQAIAAAQRVAEVHLNGGGSSSQVGAAVDYALGWDAEAHIHLADGSWKRGGDLALGDTLYGGATVCGLVRESCDYVRNYGGVLVSAAQLVYVNNVWRRAETIAGTAQSEPAVLMQIVTDICAPLCLRNPAQKAPIFLRDYREVAVPDMEEPYLAALAATTADA